MKRLLLAPLIFLINIPVVGGDIDPRILCMRNKVKFDDYIEKQLIDSRYSLNIWTPARQKAKEKAGDKFNSDGPYEEPYKSINDKWKKLSQKSSEAIYEEDLASIPILKLLGFDNPEYYIYFAYAGYKKLSEEYGVKNLRDIEAYNIARDYFGYKTKPKIARDEFCKLYGIEFDYRDEEPLFGDFKF